MVRIDVPKVRGKMAERGFNITSMAMRLGVSRNTLSGYLETPEKMPYSLGLIGMIFISSFNSLFNASK